MKKSKRQKKLHVNQGPETEIQSAFLPHLRVDLFRKHVLVDAVGRVDENDLLQYQEHKGANAGHPNEAVVVENRVGGKGHAHQESHEAKDFDVPPRVVPGLEERDMLACKNK